MPVRYHGKTAAEIVAGVEEHLRAGRLGPGDPLPPVRTLAAELSVSAATVASAYRELRHRAVIETAGRAGTRIRARPTVGRMALRLDVPAGARDLAEGGPDPRLLPRLDGPLARLAASPVWHTPTTGYDRAGALPELLTAARDRLAADGVDAPALTVTSGALDGIERALATHLGPGDRVAVEDPGWANLLDLLAALRLTPVPVPLDRDGPTVDGLRSALAAGARAVVVTSRAQNPTGAAVSADRAAALRAVLADRPDVLVIEDDHAAELSEQPLTPVVGGTAAWVFVRSVSKPYGPDLRLAVVAGDEATVDRIVGRQRLGAGWVSTVLQRLVCELWSDPDVARGIRHAREQYAARRDGLVAALADRGVTGYGRSGINVWIPVTDETAALTRLRDAGWVAAPGAAYRLVSGPAIRLTVSGLDDTDLVPLADAVAAALTHRPARYGA
ncbi:aminotransferase class I/II-fold pyridoxal phosphate-dependent enzyme [Actinocatenispora rupis]|uniref:GntR family transcriptional regulator n=1 Tax=Actinocatenispora rupis TaxID=519421 RepID=A0A8J3ISS3_9ACTN|nr:aminotransferase class I/II-fold pyridoxal phosphate-dependent enzyme [Actinocatenispora rupis]GID09236.1 GntR family transcriptional regulator [Actinocatenispora rupis]